MEEISFVKLSNIFPDDTNIIKINNRLDIVDTMAEDKIYEINKISTLEALERYPRVSGYIDYTQELINQKGVIKEANIIEEIDKNDIGDNVKNEEQDFPKCTKKKELRNNDSTKEKSKEDTDEELVKSTEQKTKEKMKVKNAKIKMSNSQQEENDKMKNVNQQKGRDQENINKKIMNKERQKSKPKEKENRDESSNNSSESDDNKVAELQKTVLIMQKQMKLLQKKSDANIQQKDNSKINRKFKEIERTKSPEKNDFKDKEKLLKKIITDVPTEIDCISTIKDILQYNENFNLNSIESLDYSHLIYKSFPKVRISKEKFLQFIKLLNNILKHVFISKHLVENRFNPHIFSNILKKSNLELKNYERSLKDQNPKQNAFMSNKFQNVDYEVPIKKKKTKKALINYDADANLIEIPMTKEETAKTKKMKPIILKSEISGNSSPQINEKLFIDFQRVNSSGKKPNLLKKLINKTELASEFKDNSKVLEKYLDFSEYLPSKPIILIEKDDSDDLTRFSDSGETRLNENFLSLDYDSDKEPKYFPIKSITRKKQPILYDPDNPDTIIEEGSNGSPPKGSILKVIKLLTLS